MLSSLLSASSQKGRGEMIQQYVSDQNIIKRVEYWDLCSYNCTTIKKRQRPLLYVSYKSKSCFMGPLFIKLLKSYVNCSNKISNCIKGREGWESWGDNIALGENIGEKPICCAGGTIVNCPRVSLSLFDFFICVPCFAYFDLCICIADICHFFYTGKIFGE